MLWKGESVILSGGGWRILSKADLTSIMRAEYINELHGSQTYTQILKHTQLYLKVS